MTRAKATMPPTISVADSPKAADDALKKTPASIMTPWPVKCNLVSPCKNARSCGDVILGGAQRYLATPRVRTLLSEHCFPTYHSVVLTKRFIAKVTKRARLSCSIHRAKLPAGLPSHLVVVSGYCPGSEFRQFSLNIREQIARLIFGKL